MEVYINTQGMTRSRFQSFKRIKSNENMQQKTSFHQLHEWQRDSTLLRSESAIKHPPGLRR